MEKERIRELISQLSVEEKAKFCSGQDFWHLQDCEKIGIKRMMVSDGPHGLRKQSDEVDHLGLNGSDKAICFPAGCALASSFDVEAAETVGDELGKLCQAENVSVILGPAMNIKRSPLCGRNFEYFSEDPLVSSEIAAAHIRGIQSHNVGACPKHFLANNQEYFRMTSNSIIDESTLHELYLASFEGAVKEAKPWTIMCSYNKINGIYASEQKWFLTDILRDEWGFDGYVMTDWGALADPVRSIEAGTDLGMPGPGSANVDRITSAVKDGILDETVLDRAVERILNIVFRYQENHVEDAVYDFENGHTVAKRIAEESAVLLKNRNAVLPLCDSDKVLVIGEYAKNPRYQGGGSSHINAYKVSGAWEVMGIRDNVSFVQGYVENGTAEENRELLFEAVKAAKAVNKAVIFAGLPESYETEGLDRRKLDIPPEQNALISAIAAVQPNTVVVLHNGSPVTMPWIKDVAAVLEMYLGGEAVGLATAELLYGEVNPCGHLAETFPVCLEDNPTYPYYGIERHDVPYREGVLVGYRYYTRKKKDILFPFGYGLSYTSFTYSDLTLDKNSMLDTDILKVNVKVTNTGTVAGKEVVQLYVAGQMQDVVRPVRELRGFKKVTLSAGESKVVSFELSKRAFAYWNVEIHDWFVSTGVYQIQIGTDAENIVLEVPIQITGTTVIKPVFNLNSTLGELMMHPIAGNIVKKAIGSMMAPAGGCGTEDENSDMEAADDVVGQVMGAVATSAGGSSDSENENSDIGETSNSALTQEAMMATGMEMPLRTLISFSGDIKYEMLEQLLSVVNEAVQKS